MMAQASIIMIITAEARHTLPPQLVAAHIACVPFAGRALDAALIADIEAAIAAVILKKARLTPSSAAAASVCFLRQMMANAAITTTTSAADLDDDDGTRASVRALERCLLYACAALPRYDDDDDDGATATTTTTNAKE